MSETACIDCLLTGRSAVAPATNPDPTVRAELELLAVSVDDCAERSRRLFGKLRKAQGSRRFDDLLGGVEQLARAGGPVGARLLAALLDRSTVADRLLPVLGGLTSIRRYAQTLNDDPRAPNPFGRRWRIRLRALSALPGADGVRPDPARETDAERWQRLGLNLAGALEQLRSAPAPRRTATKVASELLRLEVDALEERASRLAGVIDPFRVPAIQRLLPVLSALDGRIRDARGFISSLEDGEFDAVFRSPRSRALEEMEESEYRDLRRAAEASEAAPILGSLLRGREEATHPVAVIAAAAEALRGLGDCLTASGHPNSCSDLLGAVALAVGCGSAGGVSMRLGGAEIAAVEAALAAAHESPDGAPALSAIRVDGDRLRVEIDADAASERVWPHGLPAADAGLPVVDAAAGALEEEAQDDFGATEAKRLVMSNLQSMSILLSLLRNPKITAVPGLVAEVATRTRNPQVIATIAADRALFTGFANRDVPLACLRNPSNVSVKILRKFVHVKFVSKIDLKRLSQDRAGVRRELRREIDLYLETLA